MDASWYQQRREHMMAQVADNSVVILFAGSAARRTADQHTPFTPNRNFLYISGLNKEQLIFVCTKKNGQVTETLFVERPDELAAKWTGARLSADEASRLSGAESTAYIDEFQQRMTRLLLSGTYDHLYLNLEQREWQAPADVNHVFAAEMQRRYPALTIRNAYPILCGLRLIKTPEEIDHITTAIDVTRIGIERMMSVARAGIKENELEAHFDFALRVHGVQEHAFSSIVAGGTNGTVLHYEDNNQTIEDDALVLCDLGAADRYYCADISRTFPVNGKFSERQKAFYELVLQAQLETIAAIQAGVPFVRLNETTRRVLADGLKKMGLISADAELTRYFYHNVSHSLGLDTHDVGEYATLAPGMVLTIEPGLYIAEEGIGIRIEDNVLVTETGCEVLSKDIIKSVADIEAFMQSKQ